MVAIRKSPEAKKLFHRLSRPINMLRRLSDDTIWTSADQENRIGRKPTDLVFQELRQDSKGFWKRTTTIIYYEDPDTAKKELVDVRREESRTGGKQVNKLKPRVPGVNPNVL